MHCQSPPIAHRDRKAENVLIDADGVWKLCDFEHIHRSQAIWKAQGDGKLKRISLENTQLQLTRAPEMWDLYRRELISEKVDIWALGCLLYRMAYLRSVFDGKSKLQYWMGTTAFLGCHDAVPHWLNWARTCSQLLQKSTPDIMQIRCQVNELLPVELCKSSPDRPLSMASSEVLAPPMDHGDPVLTTRAPLFPSRTPPLSPTSKDQDLQSTRSKGSARRC